MNTKVVLDAIANNDALKTCLKDISIDDNQSEIAIKEISYKGKYFRISVESFDPGEILNKFWVYIEAIFLDGFYYTFKNKKEMNDKNEEWNGWWKGWSRW